MDSVNKPPPDDPGTGLPMLRTWPAVYAFVLIVFALTVAGLTALSLVYR